MSLRILHVTPYYAEAWAYGGIPRVATALTREFARRGHRVTVCTSDARDGTTRLTVSGHAEARGGTGASGPPFGVDVRVFRNLSNRLAYGYQGFVPLGLRRYLRHHAHDFDVAHVHGCHHLLGALAVRHLTRARVPYVLAPNGTAPRIERRRLAKAAFDMTIGRRVLPRADRVIAVSAAERRQLVDLGVSPGRVVLVPNPLDPAEFGDLPPAGHLRARLGLGTGPIVLYLGQLTPRKRLDVLVDAFARLGWKNARLVIAGNDRGSGRAVRARLRRSGLDQVSRMPGLLAGRERLEAFVDAAVVVYPSESEAFGLVPFEAILCGTPVVVADDSGCGEWLGRIGGGLATPAGDAVALAAAIERILERPGFWCGQAGAAAAHVRASFDVSAVCDELESVYQDLIVARGAQAAISHRPSPQEGVSFVVPILNGSRTLDAVLAAILAQDDGRPLEVIAIDDGSTDQSVQILERYARDRRVRVLQGHRRGAAAAINLGVAHASYDVVCQIDQDVLLQPGWMARVIGALQQPGVGAAQGRYVDDRRGGLLARVTALDLAQRYDRIHGPFVNHVCTGNSAYRVEALRRVGFLDESAGYGYDNDLSYRLVGAGYRLMFCRDATSVHRWRGAFSDYVRQQYGLGYGRLDVVAKHPSYVAGDDVSGWPMMLHVPLTLAVLSGVAGAVIGVITGGLWRGALSVSAIALAASLAERLVAGLAAAWRFRDPAGLVFAPVHLIRHLAWSGAVVVWTCRRLIGQRRKPEHSMARRTASRRLESDLGERESVRPRGNFVALIPAYNESDSLPAVVDELRQAALPAEIVVVDDASRDGTPVILDRLGVRWLRLGQRLGVGGAVRAGLRYAWRLGHDVVVRMDGDGQHAASDVLNLLEPIRAGRADVTLGSRFQTDGPRVTRDRRRASLTVLGRCLSLVARRRVSDPTSGFWAFGPRAVRFLADHHPSGYPEPELHLLLSRNGLHVEEVPVRTRGRLGGRTSLTALRAGHLLARTVLALAVVPLRSVVEVPRRD